MYMKNKNNDLEKLLAKLSKENYCYLTTTGHKTGNPHEIEIWFGVDGSSIYLLSGGGDKSHWVKNLQADPHVSVRIGKQTFTGTARLVKDEKEELMARHLLTGKYQGWKQGQEMSDWGKTAWVVGIDLIEK
jgi:deazaflavin-dependent oxidoreductase (nitroreductase family)